MGVEAGGPVVKDRAVLLRRDRPVAGRRGPSPRRRISRWRASARSPRKRQTTSYAAKGTVQLNSANRIDASFFGDPSHGDTGPQRTSALLRTTTSGFSTLDYGGHQQTVRYDGVAELAAGSSKASFARSLNKISELPSVNTWQVTDTTVVPNISQRRHRQLRAGNVSDSKQWSVKATNIVGGHQVKYGIQYDDVHLSAAEPAHGPDVPGGRRPPDGDRRLDPDHPGRGPRPDLPRHPRELQRLARHSADLLNFFAQDSWRVGNRLTINPGSGTSRRR